MVSSEHVSYTVTLSHLARGTKHSLRCLLLLVKLGFNRRILLVKKHINVGAVPCVLDLLIQWYPLILTPAAPAAQALHAGPYVHAHVSAARARSLHLELVPNLRAVAHRKVVDHEHRMHIISLLYHCLLPLSKDGFFTQIGADHEAVAFLAKRQDRLPDVDLGNFRVQNDLLYDRSNVFEVLWGRRCAPVQRLCHVIA